MHKECVEYTDYEDDLVRQPTMIVNMALFTTNKPVQPGLFGHNDTSAQC